MKKALITIEVEVPDERATDPTQTMQIGQDLVTNGGAFICTAYGSQSLGICSAKVVKIERLEKDRV